MDIEKGSALLSSRCQFEQYSESTHETSRTSDDASIHSSLMRSRLIYRSRWYDLSFTWHISRHMKRQHPSIDYIIWRHNIYICENTGEISVMMQYVSSFYVLIMGIENEQVSAYSRTRFKCGIGDRIIAQYLGKQCILGSKLGFWERLNVASWWISWNVHLKDFGEYVHFLPRVMGGYREAKRVQWCAYVESPGI